MITNIESQSFQANEGCVEVQVGAFEKSPSSLGEPEDFMSMMLAGVNVVKGSISDPCEGVTSRLQADDWQSAIGGKRFHLPARK